MEKKYLVIIPILFAVVLAFGCTSATSTKNIDLLIDELNELTDTNNGLINNISYKLETIGAQSAIMSKSTISSMQNDINEIKTMVNTLDTNTDIALDKIVALKSEKLTEKESSILSDLENSYEEQKAVINSTNLAIASLEKLINYLEPYLEFSDNLEKASLKEQAVSNYMSVANYDSARTALGEEEVLFSNAKMNLDKASKIIHFNFVDKLKTALNYYEDYLDDIDEALSLYQNGDRLNGDAALNRAVLNYNKFLDNMPLTGDINAELLIWFKINLQKHTDDIIQHANAADSYLNSANQKL